MSGQDDVAPRKLRILYHHRTRSKDGQNVHIEELTAALKRRGHEIIMCEPGGMREATFGEDATDEGAAIPATKTTVGSMPGVEVVVGEADEAATIPASGSVEIPAIETTATETTIENAAVGRTIKASASTDAVEIVAAPIGKAGIKKSMIRCRGLTEQDGGSQ